MNLIFDQNISLRICKKVQSHFLGCLHVSDCELSNTDDSKIWEFAKRNDFAIVTYDSDFYDMSIVNNEHIKIILLRKSNLRTDALAQLLVKHKELIKSFFDGKEDQAISCLELE